MSQARTVVSRAKIVIQPGFHNKIKFRSKVRLYYRFYTNPTIHTPQILVFTLYIYIAAVSCVFTLEWVFIHKFHNHNAARWWKNIITPQDGAPQICERWFINHEITPMNTIVISTIFSHLFGN